MPKGSHLHIAIDDTYGPDVSPTSSYVTGKRRTYVAVAFPETAIAAVRRQTCDLLEHVASYLPADAPAPSEFHFVDIYNRKTPWERLPERANLGVFGAFAEIYSAHRWEVTIQTVDDRTLTDHRISQPEGKIDGLDLSKRDDLALVFLLLKLRRKYERYDQPISLLLDEGRKKPGSFLGKEILVNWPKGTSGRYASSREEPLLQLADFLAFSINRATHLAMKTARTELDNAFLDMVGRMRINCEDLVRVTADPKFSIADFDEVHRQDRANKGLERATGSDVGTD